MKVVCTDWRKCERNTLRGFIDILVLEDGLHIRDVAAHRSHGQQWVQPQKEMSRGQR